jgi:hypothetical protein
MDDVTIAETPARRRRRAQHAEGGLMPRDTLTTDPMEGDYIRAVRPA